MNGKQDRQFQQLIDIIAIMGQHSIGYGRIEIVRPTIGVRQTRYPLEQLTHPQPQMSLERGAECSSRPNHGEDRCQVELKS